MTANLIKNIESSHPNEAFSSQLPTIPVQVLFRSIQTAHRLQTNGIATGPID